MTGRRAGGKHYSKCLCYYNRAPSSKVRRKQILVYSYGIMLYGNQFYLVNNRTRIIRSRDIVTIHGLTNGGTSLSSFKTLLWVMIVTFCRKHCCRKSLYNLHPLHGRIEA